MREHDYEEGNVFAGIASALILMCVAAGLLVAIRLVVGLVVGR